uniref:Putative group i salivary lipocalin n=1 Tax=Rhipicephalus pulchellus TaxID=72859 RepID=L7M9C7_RHIPC
MFVEYKGMTGMLKITILALVLTATGKLRNAADAKAPPAPGCANETTAQNKFQLFWREHKKVWTVNSTVIFYNCEWEEANITESGLASITHFYTYNIETGRAAITHIDAYNMIKFNWTFHKSDMMLSKREDGVIKRRLVYQNKTCAVFWDEITRRDAKSKSKPFKKGRLYRLVVDDSSETEVSDECKKRYDKARGHLQSYMIYRQECKNNSTKSSQ